MLTRPLWAARRYAPRHTHRTVFFRRSYNGQNNGPHTTYFQHPPSPPSPPRKPSRAWRFVRTVVYVGLGFWLGSGVVLNALARGGLDPLLRKLRNKHGEMDSAEFDMTNLANINVAAQDKIARAVPPMDLNIVNEILQSRSTHSVSPKAVTHSAQLPSNMPCEDGLSAGNYAFFQDPAMDWSEWGIYDGHAGPRTSNFLQVHLPGILGEKLNEAKCLEREYTANDQYIVNTIKRAFQDIDDDLINAASEVLHSDKALAEKIATTAFALSGSCALFALYDPTRSVLRVANVGDSRAVLGRWDPLGKRYIAKAMSSDQTGFNAEEVARLAREHPGEDLVDPRTGRVYGIAVSRAFGDSRWKWTEALTSKAHDMVWGPAPRPKEVIKTPPYLTAEPEIVETRIQGGDHADFLIMASDGLWDHMSSEDAVTAVQMWLEHHKPADFLQPNKTSIRDAISGDNVPPPLNYTPATDRVGAKGDDTYFDEDEKCLKWRVSPKHFVVEDEHCGEHLIKNALGGKRRDLLTGVMTIQPPLSRNVRDDITVHVIFFGMDISAELQTAAAPREAGFAGSRIEGARQS